MGCGGEGGGGVQGGARPNTSFSTAATISLPQPKNLCRNFLIFTATRNSTPQRKTLWRNLFFFAAT
jgi:hypothetical protein